MSGDKKNLHRKHFFLNQVLTPGRLIRSVLFFILAVFLTSCATPAPVHISSAPANITAIPKNARILILKPLLKFEQLKDEAAVDSSTYSGPVIESKLNDAAKDAATKRNTAIVEAAALGSPELVDLCAKLQPLSSRLASGQLNDEAKNMLLRLSEADKELLIISNFLQVKVGPGGYWDPNTGSIGSSMSTSQFRISLINCSTGQVMWKDELLVRDLPQVNDSKKFAEYVQLLYTNFPEKKGE
jgi:hypothetical protein